MKKLALLLSLFSFYPSFSQIPPVQELIRVDQFGYTCNGQKIAVIADPQTGFNSGQSFTPGTIPYEVRRWADQTIAFSGSIMQWNGGATHTQSGDKAWWFDFSNLSEPGDYYIYDPERNVRSYQFMISDGVYREVLKQAVRSFYYQRCGVPKSAPHAETGWTDGSCHIGTQQDTDCRLYNNTDASTSKDLSGGWHDAGDYNKYVNFTWETLIDMLLAYEESPEVWGDDYNIPESGNGIPDLLDEIKFELDWLLKMQQANGSVISVIGGGGGYPPSSSGAVRRYGPATTSATLTCAGVFALAAIQFKSLGIPAMDTYANTLETAAVNAWNWADANPGITFSNQPANLAAGEQEVNDYGRTSRKVTAACFLYALTDNTTYRTFFDNNYTSINMMQWTFVFPFQSGQQDMLLYYTKLPDATTSVSNNIWQKYNSSMANNSHGNLPKYTDQSDAYRAFLTDANHTWGSNSVKCKQGNIFMNMVVHNRDVANHTNYRNAASGFIHYLHGVNPLGLVYLSNMYNYGAESSVNEFYHSWFHHGSALWDRVGTSTYGPAPGFVTGGPNPSWSLDGCCPSGCGSGANNALCVNLEPPANQPVQKSYRDWNTSWPQNSWEVTENAIYYQAGFIKLLSKFSAEQCIGSPANVNHSGKNFEAVSIFPNPAQDIIHVEISSNTTGEATFEVISPTGITLHRETLFLNGPGQHSIKTDSFGKGLYILRISTADGTFNNSKMFLKE